ncbi:importin-5 [Galendromus occidentalis]|uniref:Importin-5 n=1 Tax=Galendromus occidentalis TaxID=34638 RepID=A0AAJ6QMN5_9ACAR|nr:importin-5 [Galendromus occidentalis]
MDEQAAQLLRDLMSVDNDTRQNAEQRFDAIQPPQKLMFLLTCYTLQGQTDDQRLLSMILLRRLITSEFDGFYPVLPVEHQQQLKDHLLKSIEAETTPQVGLRISECTAELARNLADDALNLPWPELQERILMWAGSQNDHWRRAGLHILADFPGVLGPQSVEIVRTVLCATLQPVNSPVIRVAAATAVSAFLRSDIMDTHEKQMRFADLIPLMVQLLADQKEETDDTVIEGLTELAEQCPKILRSHLNHLLDICLAYIQDPATLESRRNLCLELIVTLCESAPAMMRKFAVRHINALLPLILMMMADIEEDRAWDSNDNCDRDEVENDCPAVVGESSLDRLAIALGGKALLSSAMEVLAPLLNSPDWKQRHAALMAISSMGEGCKKQMTGMLDQIVEGVLRFLGDSHPRVRYAAINCLGQMANDFAPTFEKKFHSTVLPRLCDIMADNRHPRVQAHAGAALVNFFEECPKKIIVQYLSVIAPPLAGILQTQMNELATRGLKLVLEQVLVTTSALADSCGKDFIPFYDSFVPQLKYIIERANTKELELLRGKAIECVSLIGVAVGKERFTGDAAGVMELLLANEIHLHLAEDSPLLSYMIYAWMRLCKILGREFERYLPSVMPSVMKTAALSPQISLIDEDEVPDEADNEEWTYVSFDDHRSVGIRTTGLEEKATAFEMLVCFSKELKESFGPYVSEVLKVAVPTLKFCFHEGVRISAANCIPDLLACAKANNLNLPELWQFTLPEILSALDEETEMEVLPEVVDCLARCVDVVGAPGLNQEQVRKMMSIVTKCLNQHFERDLERQKQRRDEDYDEDVEEKLQEQGEEDGYLLTRVEELNRQLCKALGAEMIPFLDEVVPLFARLLQNDRPVADIQWALCFYDDITECAGAVAAIRYKDVFADKLIEYIVHPSPEIRQASAYGCGILAKFGDEQLVCYLSRAIPSLCQVISQPDSRCEKNVAATENAISAIAKIIMYRPSAVQNMDELIRMFAQWLPITEDDEEIEPCLELVCGLMEQNHAALLGVNNENVPRLIAFMLDAIRNNSIERTSPIGQRCIALVQVIQNSREIFEACARSLSDQQREVLRSLLPQ